MKYIHRPFGNRTYFKKLIMKSDVFVCPRLKEGIGMANIEALALGKYLIANDDATMSEYIINDKIGIFYNYSQKKKLNISKVYNYNLERYNYCLKGFNLFKKKIDKIIDLSKKKIIKNFNPLTFLILYFKIKLYTFKRKLILFWN